MEESTVSSAAAAMAAGDDAPEIETAIHRGVIALSQIVLNFLEKDIELTRICRLATLLQESGVSAETALFRDLAQKCIETQRDDGGWTDVIETTWCTTFLDLCGEFSNPVGKAHKWLGDQRNEGGGWGKSNRDSARIPVTGLLLYMLPRLSTGKDLHWLEEKWQQEQQNDPCLTYKAAFTLMAFGQNSYNPQDKKLISNTIQWLYDQQNDDGGWAPWKGHPVGSDPWCTGIAIAGLLQYPDEISEGIIRKALQWLQDTQLSNGLWPYHYIDDGSGWALYTLVLGYRFLGNK